MQGKLQSYKNKHMRAEQRRQIKGAISNINS